MAPIKLKTFIKNYTQLKDRNHLKERLLQLRDALQKEGEQSLEMFETYFKYSQGSATEEDMEKANKQLGDFLKTIGLGFFVILPGAPITIPLIIKWGEKFGVDIIPDSFRNMDSTPNKKKTSKKKKKPTK